MALSDDIVSQVGNLAWMSLGIECDTHFDPLHSGGHDQMTRASIVWCKHLVMANISGKPVIENMPPIFKDVGPIDIATLINNVSSAIDDLCKSYISNHVRFYSEGLKAREYRWLYAEVINDLYNDTITQVFRFPK